MANKIIPKFAYGTSSALENKMITPGTIYFTSDTHQLVIDTPTGVRVVASKDYEQRVSNLETQLAGIEDLLEDLL